MNLAVQPPILDPVAVYNSRHLCIPTRADVDAAAALLRPPARDYEPPEFARYRTRQSPRAYVMPRWFLTISPGVVRVGRRLSMPKEHYGHTDGVTLVEEAPRRGRVAAWSERSRNRMAVTLESLDYGPMFASGRRAAMVTLTLPGDGWEQLVPDIPTFKRMVNRLTIAYGKAWGEPLRGTWKMEFQRRGAPHLHILMVPPAGRARGRGITKGLPFSNWLSIRWAQIVGAPEGTRARRDHELAGTGIDYAEVGRYSDPRRIGSYFAKHGSFAAKDYQNEMPDHWRAAILAGETGGGNFWGYWGLEKAEATIELRGNLDLGSHRVRDFEPHRARRAAPLLGPEGAPQPQNRHYDSRGWHPDRPPQDAVLVMRHLRKLARARSFVRKVEVTRWSVDLSTGVLTERRRRVNRRVEYLAGRSRGFLSVNDGPSTARDIARLLHEVEGPGRDHRPDAYDLVA